ncbi:MAG: glycosyltransferase family 2 protein, partial [Fidelibacterota bacterium]
MTFLIIILYGILGLFLLVTLVNVTTGPRLSHPPKKSRFTNPTISVLVPARNEEHNLPACLESLLALDPAPAEILVLDDHSTDKTWEIIQGFAFKHKQVRGIRGKELPAGWVGKTWACHQLSQEASGEILVFTDADNTYHPAALERSVRWMQALNLDMLSAFPQQTLKTLPEKLVIPVV